MESIDCQFNYSSDSHIGCYEEESYFLCNQLVYCVRASLVLYQVAEEVKLGDNL